MAALVKFIWCHRWPVRLIVYASKGHIPIPTSVSIMKPNILSRVSYN